MINKIMILIGLLCTQLPTMASNANANAAAAPASTNSVIAEADVKSGAKSAPADTRGPSDSRANGLELVGPKGGTKVVVSEADRKKWRFSDEDTIARIDKLVAGPTEELRAALDRGDITAYAGVDSMTGGYWPILSVAVISGSLETIALLIERGADVNELNSGGGSPIAFASLDGRFARTLKLFYMAGADLFVGYGRGIFRHAQIPNHLEVPNRQKYIELLVALGVDLEATDGAPLGKTTLGKVVIQFFPSPKGDAVKALVACGADTSCLEEAIGENHWRQQVGPLIREEVKEGEKIFMEEKQLPLVKQKLQETFAGYSDYVRLFGKEFAPIINDYAGRLILPRRVYTDAEKLKALDELVAFEEAEENRKKAQQAAQAAEQPK